MNMHGKFNEACDSNIDSGNIIFLLKFTPVVERLERELTQPVLTTWVCCDRGSIPELLNASQMLYQLIHRSGLLRIACITVHI